MPIGHRALMQILHGPPEVQEARAKLQKDDIKREVDRLAESQRLQAEALDLERRKVEALEATAATLDKILQAILDPNVVIKVPVELKPMIGRRY